MESEYGTYSAWHIEMESDLCFKRNLYNNSL